jgi:transcription elongation GreA/GreB family factor
VTINKQAVVQQIITQLQSDLELYFKAARSAHAEATHEQSKAENKYDTRGLEASYLARGQSRQAAEIEQAILQFQSLPVRQFGPTDGIEVGALVELVSGSRKAEATRYFIGPRAGGTEVTCAKREITVITPQSPLGRQLLGRRQGEQFQLELAGTTSDCRIAAVT